MITIFKIPKEEVGLWWPHLRDYLQAALEKYDMHKVYPLDQVLIDVTGGCAQAWAIKSDDKIVSAMVTELTDYPLAKVLNVFLVGGEGMADWGDMLHRALVRYAKEEKATLIETGSRRGIGKRFYDRLGYKRRYESYTFEVN